MCEDYKNQIVFKGFVLILWALMPLVVLLSHHFLPVCGVIPAHSALPFLAFDRDLNCSSLRCAGGQRSGVTLIAGSTE